MEKIMNQVHKNLNSIYGANFAVSEGNNIMRYFRYGNGNWNAVCVDNNRPNESAVFCSVSPAHVEAMAEALLTHGGPWPEIAKEIAETAIV